MMTERRNLKDLYASVKDDFEYIGFRHTREITHHQKFRNGTQEPAPSFVDSGLMIEILSRGQIFYSATCDLSAKGIRNCLDQVKLFANNFKQTPLFANSTANRPKALGTFKSTRQSDLKDLSFRELHDFLRQSSNLIKNQKNIIAGQSYVKLVQSNTLFLGNQGTEFEQDLNIVGIELSATAEANGDIQKRTSNRYLGRCYQMGSEFLQNTQSEFDKCLNISEEALQLCWARQCPSEKMDLLLAPDQMMLQIHESIGHPLEYDRILGDERNFAGWSFVRPTDFGQLQYGSELMNIVFDPTPTNAIATYAIDESGLLAKREFLIEKGILKRGLGGLESQQRLKIPGVANFRASQWNRPPVDRMANINLFPGTTPLAEMLRKIEHGIFMQTNKSWSIDDYRLKFQFGCEWAQEIKGGKLGQVFKNPNYRDSSLQFWRKLKDLGKDTESYGTFYCGKAEPGQVIRVSHESPHCVFADVEVFGGIS